MKTTLTILVFLFCLTSCQEKFDSAKWKVKENENSYPHRAKMLDDIIKTRNLIGYSRQRVTDLMGKADQVKDDKMYYTIEASYDKDRQPVHVKQLVLFLDKKSVVKEIGVTEEDRS
jgi:hypothetical protein